MRMDDKRTMEALQKGLAGYEKVVDKEIHYVYLKDRRYHELVFKPHKRNFMHLCGVEYFKSEKKVTAYTFYEELKAKRVDIQGIRKKSYTDQKLEILDQLKDLITCNLRILDKKTTYSHLTFTHGIRSRKKIFCLALENEETSGHFIPSSLLNLRNNSKGNSIKPGHPVDCIYTVDDKMQSIQILCQTAQFIEYEKTNTYIYKSTPLQT